MPSPWFSMDGKGGWGRSITSSSPASKSSIQSEANGLTRSFNGWHAYMARIAPWCLRIMKWSMQPERPGHSSWST